MKILVFTLSLFIGLNGLFSQDQEKASGNQILKENSKKSSKGLKDLSNGLAALSNDFRYLNCLYTLNNSSDLEKLQDKPRASPLMKTEMDMGDLKVKVQYGSPSVKGREIFGKLVSYDKVWRTGANEATVFEINNPITVERRTLAAGKYSLFTIPGEDKWIIIFNSVSDQWGAYKYSDKKDVLRVEVKPGMIPDQTEKFTIKLENGFMFLIWDHTSVQVALN
jgi:hypothetical protein|tara:strand:- start:21 stop:686 length:666 start_codon:yes stop_codon:yes gene_type:complete